MTAPETTDEKSIFVFLTKAVCAFIAIPVAMYIIFPGAARLCLNDKLFSLLLMVLNSWTVLGVLICTFMLAPEYRKNHKQLWLVFFVPTIGLYLTAPLYCSLKFSIDRAYSSVKTQLEIASPKYYMLDNGTVVKTDPTVQEDISLSAKPSAKPSPFKKNLPAPAIFYARYPIQAGNAFSISNVKVLPAVDGASNEGILANSESFFGENGSIKSILAHKAKKMIEAGKIIKNSDIEPPYDENFVLPLK